jgi:hypothetical protein
MCTGVDDPGDSAASTDRNSAHAGSATWRSLREEGDRRGPDVAQSAGASRAILLSPVQRLPYAEQAAEVPEESIPELRASPQNPHKSGSAGRLPTKTHGQDGIPRHTAARLLPWPYHP